MGLSPGLERSAEEMKKISKYTHSLVINMGPSSSQLLRELQRCYKCLTDPLGGEEKK